MKTLISVGKLELIKNANHLTVVQSGYCRGKFALDQFIPAVASLLYLLKQSQAKLPEKAISSLQPDLFNQE